MKFEFNAVKSKTNKAKHGIDFIEIQAVWDDPDLLEIPAKVSDEERYLLIGCWAGRHWSVVVTYRDDKIRIISARRARKEEVLLYENS